MPYKVITEKPESLQPLDPSAARIEGWLGARIDASVGGRLEVVDTAPLLAGFIKKPGNHPWIGEHVGKWIHAATLAREYTGDSALRGKLDSVVAELIAAQEPDGYLGTYLPSQCFGLYQDADWCCYTAPQGSRHYDAGITCCHSSGPRALAVAPTTAYLQTSDTAVVSTFESSQAHFTFDGQPVGIDQRGGFPREGHSVLTVRVSQPVRFGIRVRVPARAAKVAQTPRIGSNCADWGGILGSISEPNVRRPPC